MHTTWILKNNLKTGLFILAMFCLGVTTFGQRISLNDSLNGFTAELENRFGIKKQLNGDLFILHLGDSHIQPGGMTIPLSEAVHSVYGNAGYGLAFPYQVAKTNGQDGYQTKSNVAWEVSKIIHSKKQFPVGVSGYTIHTKDVNAKITWEFDSLSYDNQVQKIELFHGNVLDSNFQYQIVSEFGEYAKPQRHLSDACHSVFILERPTYVFDLFHEQQFAFQTSSTLYGVKVSNGDPGAIVSAVGVNGATYQHYSESVEFRNQLEKLQPDVVVISLGTNEAFQFGDFDDTTFFDQSLNLIQMISSLESQPIIVLTTPPAVSKVQYKNKKSYFIPNPLVPRVRAVIMDIGLRLDIPIYDLYSYMGGEDSMKNWAQLGMTDKKRIHFSPKGYRILGEGMRNAMDNHLPQ